MLQSFDRDGIHFQYPANWSLEPSEEAEEGWTVTLQSPETAFLLVSLRPAAGNPAELADQTLEVIEADYKEFEAENAVEQIAGQVAIGHDIDFLTLDTAVAAWTRCVETPAGPLLVMGQASEYDRERNEPVLRAIFASLTIEDE